jgi:cytidyltransferase-like protein
MVNPKIEKEFIKKILVEKLKNPKISYNKIIESYSPFLEENRKVAEQLIKKGKIKTTGKQVTVTESGRKYVKVILCGGTFDIIHPGHLLTLGMAKSLGDVLVVIVSTDETAEKNRGRKTYNNEEKRLELVSSLRIVDFAMIGEKGNIYNTLIKINPDIVALGYDQIHNEKEIKEFAKSKGKKIKVIRFTKSIGGIKSSSLLKDDNLVNET